MLDVEETPYGSNGRRLTFTHPLIHLPEQSRFPPPFQYLKSLSLFLLALKNKIKLIHSVGNRRREEFKGDSYNSMVYMDSFETRPTNERVVTSIGIQSEWRPT